MHKKLEVIGFTIEGCIIARNANADRIELCDNPGEGGTTPSYGFIKLAREIFPGELYPIIRPRGGDFLYSDNEFKIMETDVSICKQLGCDGIVTGILLKNGIVDKLRTAMLVELASPMGVTFHRAFDRVADPFEALEDIIETGCERVLTSGLQPEALSGMQLIKKLVETSAGRIIIMPGSGVRSSNIGMLMEITGAAEFHSSARIKKNGEMGYHNSAMDENLVYETVDEEEVKNMLVIIRKR